MNSDEGGCSSDTSGFTVTGVTRLVIETQPDGRLTFKELKQGESPYPKFENKHKTEKCEALKVIEDIAPDMDESKRICHVCKEERSEDNKFDYLIDKFQREDRHETYCESYGCEMEDIRVKGQWDCSHGHLNGYMYIMKKLKESIRLYAFIERLAKLKPGLMFTSKYEYVVDTSKFKQLFGCGSP